MSNKRNDNELPTNLVSVRKIVKISLYSTIDRVDGKLVGEIIDYIDTPIEWLEDDLSKKH